MADDVLPADEVAELRRLIDAATQGPWELVVNERSWSDQTGEHYAQVEWSLHPPGWRQVDNPNPDLDAGWVLAGMDDRGEFDQVRADAELIAAARNALPSLLAEVESLRATVARLRTAADDLLDAWDAHVDSLMACGDDEPATASANVARTLVARETAIEALRAALDATTAERPTDG